MKRMIKYAAAASVAGALALGMATPSHAASAKGKAFSAGRVNAGVNSGRYNPGFKHPTPGYNNYSRNRMGYDVRQPRYGAYAYAPAGVGSSEPSCATEGTYGKPVDYASCY